jgi:hypothetical protein
MVCVYRLEHGDADTTEVCLAGFVACPVSDIHQSAQFSVVYLRLDIRGLTFPKYLTLSAFSLVTTVRRPKTCYQQLWTPEGLLMAVIKEIRCRGRLYIKFKEKLEKNPLLRIIILVSFEFIKLICRI